MKPVCRIPQAGIAEKDKLKMANLFLGFALFLIFFEKYLK